MPGHPQAQEMQPNEQEELKQPPYVVGQALEDDLEGSDSLERDTRSNNMLNPTDSNSKLPPPIDTDLEVPERAPILPGINIAKLQSVKAS